MRSLVTMKNKNLIIKIFLGSYLVIIIAGVAIFEHIGFSGGGLEKKSHTVSNSETQAVVKDISTETVSQTTLATTIKETASVQTAAKESTAATKESATSTQESAATTKESIVATLAQTSDTELIASASETACESSEPENIPAVTEDTQPVQTVTPTPSYTFANGRRTNTSSLKSYRVTGAYYVNMHNNKNGDHPIAAVPGGTTGSIISVGAYYTLINYNGKSGYVYNSYLEVY